VRPCHSSIIVSRKQTVVDAYTTGLPRCGTRDAEVEVLEFAMPAKKQNCLATRGSTYPPAIMTGGLVANCWSRTILHTPCSSNLWHEHSCIHAQLLSDVSPPPIRILLSLAAPSPRATSLIHRPRAIRMTSKNGVKRR